MIVEQGGAGTRVGTRRGAGTGTDAGQDKCQYAGPRGEGRTGFRIVAGGWL